WQFDMALDSTRRRTTIQGSYARALRDYERALALDESDHTLFANVVDIYSTIGSKDGTQIPGFDGQPTGDLPTVFNRIPDAYFVPVYVADTVALIPAESIAARFPPRVLDSLRGRARAKALEVTRRWLSVAPLEGNAYLRLAFLSLASQQYDSALAALDRARVLGVANADQIPFLRLQALASSRRWHPMAALADSLGQVGPDSAYRAYSLQAAAIANVWVVGGRLDQAGQLVTLLQQDVGQRNPEIHRFIEASPDFFGLLARSGAGTVTRAEVQRASAAYRRGLARLSGPGQERMRGIIRTPVRVAAAAVGDTATLAQWPQEGADTNWSLYAWAYAEAGDTARTRRALVKVGADTGTQSIRLWSLAQANEALGRQDLALKYYERLDSLPVNLSSDVDPFVLYQVRALPAAAAILEARGDTARAAEK
ncbi:MAG TPA: hypothetical protein VFI13_01620, partial [Gemmatimonadales bacterium]|nr:hypothetical protein [Gemmatimonadales bacterium]